MNTEYRRARRRKVGYNIEVYDTMTDEVIGRLSNLSETGMLMVSHKAIANDALFQLRVSLPNQMGVMKPIDIGAHELWSDEATAPGQTWIGFRFIDVSQSDVAYIRDWVDAPGGHYV
ncbi:MAG: PilZ domain-containing protein [Arenimonas sp.]